MHHDQVKCIPGFQRWKKSMKQKSWCFEKINKIDKSLPQLTKGAEGEDTNY